MLIEPHLFGRTGFAAITLAPALVLFTLVWRCPLRVRIAWWSALRWRGRLGGAAVTPVRVAPPARPVRVQD